MNEKSFAVAVENTLTELLTRIEERAADVECDLVDSVLTLLLPDGSQIIINRQEAVQQIWLACSDGPARFSAKDDQWLDSKTGESLTTALGRLLSHRLHDHIVLD
jgi:CyaY protein